MGKTKNIALVTDRQNPGLSDDDKLLLNPLANAGFIPEPVIWDDEKIDWSSFSAVIMRSAWDYHLNIDKFKNWLRLLQKNKQIVWNPVKDLLWNIDKIYLINLKKLGINVIPTYKSTDNINLDSKEVIIKPRFGASGYGVKKIKSPNKKSFPSGCLIQPFIREITDIGELSIIFINNKYSHCIRKIPKKGDFRSQFLFGAKWVAEKLDQKYINQAENIIKKLGKDLLYARVDAVEINGKLMLMELEITEPYLFFSWYKPSVNFFVESLLAKIS